MSRPDAESDTAPAWFQQAIGRAPEHRDVEVAGTRIHYRAWGDPALPGLVLVHGGAAHSGWWDHIAPQLRSHRVVALDLSGHGDSGRRSAYDMTLWAEEVVAVAADAGLHSPVVLGHSMGGWVALTIGVEHPEAVSAVAVIDSPLVREPPEEERLRERQRPHRPYPSAEEAMTRFRSLPPQDVLLPCPAALFRCEKGLVTREMAVDMAGLVPGGLPVVDLPDAGHHPMLDQPLALVTGIRTLLAFWPHGADRRPDAAPTL